MQVRRRRSVHEFGQHPVGQIVQDDVFSQEVTRARMNGTGNVNHRTMAEHDRSLQETLQHACRQRPDDFRINPI